MSQKSKTLLGDDQGVVLPEEDDAHVDFGTFIISLGHSAYIAMGMAGHPDGIDGITDGVNVEAAKELIDILEMLEKKTKGNLEEEETQMLSSLLYELRIAFVNLD